MGRSGGKNRIKTSSRARVSRSQTAALKNKASLKAIKNSFVLSGLINYEGGVTTNLEDYDVERSSLKGEIKSIRGALKIQTRISSPLIEQKAKGTLIPRRTEYPVRIIEPSPSEAKSGDSQVALVIENPYDYLANERKDILVEWFDTVEEAEKFVEEEGRAVVAHHESKVLHLAATQEQARNELKSLEETGVPVGDIHFINDPLNQGRSLDRPGERQPTSLEGAFDKVYEIRDGLPGALGPLFSFSSRLNTQVGAFEVKELDNGYKLFKFSVHGGGSYSTTRVNGGIGSWKHPDREYVVIIDKRGRKVQTLEGAVVELNGSERQTIRQELSDKAESFIKNQN
jgi:hypothetical protein